MASLTAGPIPPERSPLYPFRLLLLLAAFSLVVPASATAAPVGQAAATCSDYDNQADAQRAKDTRDADGDGIYCEALPCPCL